MISIVVPVFNEEESILNFYKDLLTALKVLSKEYEVIFVDDGSVDNSLFLLKELNKKNKNVRVYSFRKNQGKAEALTFGFSQAKGSYILTLDADLQDRPEEIQKLFTKMLEGWDVVCGWRKERKDPLRKIISSKFFNVLASVFWGLKLHDYNCGLKLYTREAAKSLYLYGGLHRFIPLLLHQEGFRITETAIVHSERKFGKSKYGFSKLWKDLPDIFTMLFLSRYSMQPLHFFGTIGGILFTVGLIILGYLSLLHFQGEGIGRRPLLFLGILLVVAGFQIFFTGFLADFILSLYRRNGAREDPTRLLRYFTD